MRRPQTLRGWLAAYAAAATATTSYNAILDAATAGEGDKPAKTTTIAYRDILERDDGRVLALEVKLARTVGSDDVAHLLWFYVTGSGRTSSTPR